MQAKVGTSAAGWVRPSALKNMIHMEVRAYGVQEATHNASRKHTILVRVLFIYRKCIDATEQTCFIHSLAQRFSTSSFRDPF